MNKFKITVTTALLGLSLMSLSTYSYEFNLEQAKIEEARTKHAIQAAIEMGAGNYSKAIEYAEPVANAPITEFNQEIVASAQFSLGYSYLAKKNNWKNYRAFVIKCWICFYLRRCSYI